MHWSPHLHLHHSKPGILKGLPSSTFFPFHSSVYRKLQPIPTKNTSQQRRRNVAKKNILLALENPFSHKIYWFWQMHRALWWTGPDFRLFICFFAALWPHWVLVFPYEDLSCGSLQSAPVHKGSTEHSTYSCRDQPTLRKVTRRT